MNRKAVRWVFVGLVLALAVWAVQYWRSDERRIRRQLDRLEELVAKQSGENNLTAARKANAFGEYFTRELELRAPAYDLVVRDRGQLARALLQYRSLASSLKVAIRPRDLEVDSDLGIARCELEVEVTSDTGREGYRFTAAWRREEESWRLEQVELVEVLDAPSWLPF